MSFRLQPSFLNQLSTVPSHYSRALCEDAITPGVFHAPLCLPSRRSEKELGYTKKMHIHIPTIVWIKFLGVSPHMRILKSNPGVPLSKNRHSGGNRSWEIEPITKRITALVRQC